MFQIPLAALALGLTVAGIREDKKKAAHVRLDVAGAVLLSVALALVSVAISALSKADFLSSAVVLTGAFGAFALFVRVETQSADPILPLHLLTAPSLRVSLVMNAVVSCVMMGILVVGPFFLTGGLGLTLAQMGVAMSVGPISSALSGVPAGWLTERLGAQRAVQWGAGAVMLGAGGMAGLPPLLGLSGFVLAFILLAPGYQLFLAALNTSAMQRALPAQRGVTSGLMNLSRNFGFVVGASAVSALFWGLTQVKDVGDIAFAMAGTFAILAALMGGVFCLALSWGGTARGARS